MRIGIDARLWNETGVGRYIRALVKYLQKIDDKNEYILFVKKNEYDSLQLTNARWRLLLADINWHTLSEQFDIPKLYMQAHLDLVHIPYFSVPYFISNSFIVTIHDLTISNFATGKATTKPWPIYLLKRLGYQFVLSHALSKAKLIITVSQTVKNQILDTYPVKADKIHVTYEAGELEYNSKGNTRVPKKYILYVGNAHPHKNLERLLGAFNTLAHINKDLKLVLIGKHDYFYQRLMKKISDRKLPGVIFVGTVNNGELNIWYKHALCLVFPSLSEGFGIPGLEAMGCGCPVVASDLPIFHEIYHDAALYFDPGDTLDISNSIQSLIVDQKKRSALISKGKQIFKLYSWEKMARETNILYESSTRL